MLSRTTIEQMVFGSSVVGPGCEGATSRKAIYGLTGVLLNGEGTGNVLSNCKRGIVNLRGIAGTFRRRKVLSTGL